MGSNKRRRRQVVALTRYFSIDKDDYDIVSKILQNSEGEGIRLQDVVEVEDGCERRVRELKWYGSIHKDLNPSIIVELDGLTHLTFECGYFPTYKKSFPQNIGKLRNLKYLNVSNLYYLPPSIGELLCLEELKIKFCDKPDFLPDEIGNLANLKKLSVLAATYRYFYSLPESIGRLKSLKELHIQGYAGGSVPGTICDLVGLEELVLQQDQMKTLPDRVGDLLGLRRLDLRGCPHLQIIPPSFWQLPNLTALTLPDIFWRSKIKSLTNEICELISLEELTVPNPHLKSLPNDIGDLVNLKELDLRKTSIEVLPPSFWRLHNLEVLILGRKTSLLDGISNLVNLKKLSLGELYCESFLERFKSSLESFPDDIGNLVSLEILEIFGARIESLPHSFGNLRNLKELTLESRYMGGSAYKIEGIIHADQIESLTSLEKLVLHGAKSLPPLGRLKNLRELELQYTFAKELPTSIGCLKNIKELYLAGHKKYLSHGNSYNAFTETLPRPVLQLQNIEKLSLACHGDISGLPEKLTTLKNLNELNLVGLKVATNFSESGSYFRFLWKLVRGCRLLATLNCRGKPRALWPEEKRKVNFLLACNQNRGMTRFLRSKPDLSSLMLWPFAIRSAVTFHRKRRGNYTDGHHDRDINWLEPADAIYSFLCDNKDVLVRHFLSLHKQ